MHHIHVSQVLVQQTRREAGFLQLLRGHPNIVQLYDAIWLVNHLTRPYPAYFAMKTAYLHCDLKRAINDAGNALETAPLLVRMLRHVSRAVDYMHRNGVVHHDLKPANIMLRYTRMDGTPMERLLAATFVVIDFGLAKQYPLGVQIEDSGYRAGTQKYKSPEKCSSSTYDAFAADWYALGIIALWIANPDLWPTLNQKNSFYKEFKEEFSEMPQTARELAFLLSLLRQDQEIFGIILDFLMVDRAQYPIEQVLARLEALGGGF